MFDSPKLADLAKTWGRVTVALLIAFALLVPASLKASQFGDDPSSDPSPAASTSQQLPAKPTRLNRVYDLPGRLDKSQFDRFHYDIGRLWDDGIPSLIYIRSATATEEQSQYFADQLRDTWDIDSSPEAADGLVFLITIRETFPKTATLTLSYGAKVFPAGQMTLDDLNNVVNTEVDPRLSVGNVNGGLTYALRRILYSIEYTAPFPPERTAGQDIAHTLSIPLCVLFGIALLGLITLSDNRFPLKFREHRKVISIALGVVLVFASLWIAVFGRSSAATAVGLLNLIPLAVLLWKLGKSPDGRRILRTNPPRNRKVQRTRLSRTHTRV